MQKVAKSDCEKGAIIIIILLNTKINGSPYLLTMGKSAAIASYFSGANCIPCPQYIWRLDVARTLCQFSCLRVTTSHPVSSLKQISSRKCSICVTVKRPALKPCCELLIEQVVFFHVLHNLLPHNSFEDFDQVVSHGYWAVVCRETLFSSFVDWGNVTLRFPFWQQCMVQRGSPYLCNGEFCYIFKSIKYTSCGVEWAVFELVVKWETSCLQLLCVQVYWAVVCRWLCVRPEQCVQPQ